MLPKIAVLYALFGSSLNTLADIFPLSTLAS
jgi:hypothetical protein